MNTYAYRSPAVGDVIVHKFFYTQMPVKYFIVIDQEVLTNSFNEFVTNMKCLTTGKLVKQATQMVRKNYSLLEDL